MKVDLARLRRVAASGGWGWHVDTHALEALLAVVDAARAYVADVHPVGFDRLVAALEPFAPADRAWEEVDRWNAERDTFTVRPLGFVSERDLAVKAAVDATKPNPRDRARDQLADAGVAVQRQFRSDQERIAELERQLEAERTRGIDHAVYEMVCEERDALRATRPCPGTTG